MDRLSWPRVLVLSLIFGGAGCATPSEGLIIGYDWIGGDHESLLSETFGEDITHRGINFYKLSNAWNPVYPNALNITKERVRYVEVKDGKPQTSNFSIQDCPKLVEAISNFHKDLNNSIAMISGTLKYRKTRYLDPPDYLVEAYGPEGQIRLGELEASLPVVEGARIIIKILEECRAA